MQSTKWVHEAYEIQLPSSLGPKSRWPWNLVCSIEYSSTGSNDAPGLTLTYFPARSNLVAYAFVWEKVKTMDFSETIVVYDIMVGRCSQLNEYMKIWVQKTRVIRWPCCKSLIFNIFKLFSSITTDLNISSALRWAIQDQWSSGIIFMDQHIVWLGA